MGRFEAVAGLVHTGAGAAAVCAETGGVLRGLLPSGIAVRKGMKSGDVDPRGSKCYCFTVSDKAPAGSG